MPTLGFLLGCGCWLIIGLFLMWLLNRLRQPAWMRDDDEFEISFVIFWPYTLILILIVIVKMISDHVRRSP